MKSKSSRRYSEEFRRRMVDLVRGGRSPESLSKEFEPTAQAIRNWVRTADLEEGRRSDGWTREERQALRELFTFIEGWYNTRRRHSALGYLSPVAFEREFEAA